MAFPDVCWTPTPPEAASRLPVPYPVFATTAVQTQKKKLVGEPVVNVSTVAAARMGTALKAPTAAKASETQQIKVAMNAANARLQSMLTTDPNQWQAVVFEYIVLTSALFVTQTNG